MRDVAETIRTLEYAANADNEEMLRWWKASTRQDCIDLCAYVARLKRIEGAASWGMHVIHGVGKAGGKPEPGEDDAAFAALEAALKERDDA